MTPLCKVTVEDELKSHKKAVKTLKKGLEHSQKSCDLYVEIVATQKATIAELRKELRAKNRRPQRRNTRKLPAQGRALAL
eukprot:9154727-Pyramimonas_sp.AAC.1